MIIDRGKSTIPERFYTLRSAQVYVDARSAETDKRGIRIGPRSGFFPLLYPRDNRDLYFDKPFAGDFGALVGSNDWSPRDWIRWKKHGEKKKLE